MVDSVARANATRLLTDQGDPVTQLEYGHYSMKDQDFEKSIEEGTECYKLSADQRNSNGQLYYGNYLEFDKDVSVDFSEAAHYYSLSADQGKSAGHSITAVTSNLQRHFP
jgi:TPR repeat protein